MRTINELYKILLRVSNKSEMKDYGICYSIGQLWTDNKITYPESLRLEGHFEGNRPSKTLHKEFYYETLYNGRESAYWWITCDEYTRGRIDNGHEELEGSAIPPRTIRTQFIKHMIETTKDI